MGTLASHPAVVPFIPPLPLRRYIPFRFRRPVQTACTASAASQTSDAKETRLRTPYDLVHFRRSRFVAHLNELRRRGMLPPDADVDPATRLDRALRSAGQAHEKRVIEHVKNLIPNAEICSIPFGHPERYKLTETAISQEMPLIQGAAFKDDLFAGYADLLIHASVDPFSTGSGYAVCEIKMASLQTADFVLQVSAYATMLNQLQSRLGLPTSTYSYLWLGSPEIPPKKLEFRTLRYFFSRTRKDYRLFVQDFASSPIPEPDGPLDKLNPWKTYAGQILEDADSLRLIAGIRRSQAREIEAVTGATTLEEYAAYESAKVDNFVRSRVLSPVHRRLHKQARLQHATRSNGKMTFEKVEGVSKGMPASATGDMFFDIEGFPLVSNGLEYLFGVSNEESFYHWWAHTRIEEERAFVQLMDFFKRVLHVEDDETQPHIYHYGHYEVTALQRVAMRVKTLQGIAAAQIFERLIERDLFFDVYEFVRKSLVVGAASYSIKQIEKLVGVSRQGDELTDAESSVGMYYEWRSAIPESDIDADGAVHQKHPLLDEILNYNRQDCESLQEVVAWLQIQLPSILRPGVDEGTCDEAEELEKDENTTPIMPGACGRSHEHKIADSAVIARSAELGIQIHHLPASALEPIGKQCLSHLLQFHVRESLPVRHAFRKKIELAQSSDLEDLFQDDKCLSGVRLLRTSVDGPSGKEKKVFVYSFDERQPASFTEGESVAFVMSNPTQGSQIPLNGSINTFMTVKALQRTNKGTGEVVLAGGRDEDFCPPGYGTLISTDDLKICDAPLRDSILRKAEKFALDQNGPSLSLPIAFLNRENLSVQDAELTKSFLSLSGPALCEELSTFLADQKHSNVFVIQGPPGSGKTYLSARLIHNLVQNHNKTVAVSSNSHYAIDKLLCGSADVGLDKDVIYKAGKRPLNKDKVSSKANVRDLIIAPLSAADSNECAGVKPANHPDAGSNRKRRNNRAALVGATCYQLAQEECDGKFDFLFIDEASQVNLANFLSMAGSAKYAVLVGDQQQLEMPIRGSHPDPAGVNCLSYAVGDDVSVVQPTRGIFLKKSYRMNPETCSFISESFYDNALQAADECSVNNIILPQSKDSLVRAGFGIQFIPCDSFAPRGMEGSPNVVGKWHRPAEIVVLTKVVEELLGSRYETRTVPLSAGRRLDETDILVVAPYNAQVRALQTALPSGIRVGTVDKVQGQEAPVVLISSCAGYMNYNAAGFSDAGEEYEDGSLVGDSFSGMPSQEQGAQRRGLRFALRRNRLNVAISRAECLAVVTGHSNACSKMTLDSYEDIETAALYESLQMYGRSND